jgi:hypothetical protein
MEKEKQAPLRPGEKVRITPELRTPGRVSVNLPRAMGVAKAATVKAATVKAATVKAATVKAATVKAATVKAATVKAATVKAATMSARSVPKANTVRKT